MQTNSTSNRHEHIFILSRVQMKTFSTRKMNGSHTDPIGVVIQLTNKIFPPIILPLATVGNSLCFLVFCRAKFQKRLTRTSSICLRLLCLNDLILLYLFIIDVLLRVYTEQSMRIYWSVMTCRLYKWVRYSLLDCSAYIQVGLTTDRFICCVHHAYYSRWRKRNHLFHLLAIALILIFVKNSLFLSTSYGYAALNKYNRSTVRCAAKIHAKHFSVYLAYGQSLIDVVFITCLPFFLILYLNSRILREVLRLRTECWSTFTRLMTITPRQSESSLSISTTTHIPSYPSTTVIATNHRSRHRRLHLTFALGCISFVFIFSTAPYKIFKIIERHDKVIRDQRLNGAQKSMQIQLAEVIIDCFVFVSCSTPFFVCFATSSMFREEVRRMFR